MKARGFNVLLCLVRRECVNCAPVTEGSRVTACPAWGAVHQRLSTRCRNWVASKHRGKLKVNTAAPATEKVSDFSYIVRAAEQLAEKNSADMETLIR